MTDDHVSEYRGQRFLVQARHDGRSWTGHYMLLGIDAEQARRAAEEGRHQWTPMDPGWGTQPEAERMATEAAHAAIDALACRTELPPP